MREVFDHILFVFLYEVKVIATGPDIHCLHLNLVEFAKSKCVDKIMNR